MMADGVLFGCDTNLLFGNRRKCWRKRLGKAVRLLSNGSHGDPKRNMVIFIGFPPR